MIECLRLRRLSMRRELSVVWPVVLALLLLVSILWICGPAAEAGDSGAATQPALAPPAMPQSMGPTSASPTRPSGAALDVEASGALTSVLPLLSKTYWTSPDSSLGSQIFASNEESEAKMRRMGARWARLPIAWDSIEPTNTEPISYHWPVAFDDELARLSANHIQVILTLTGNPSWAAHYAGGPIDLVDIGELTEFMVAAVARYGKPPYNVKYWEFYNEPDNGSTLYAEYGWGYWGNDGAAYARMLAAVRGPMKAADPDAQIVFGGLAYDWWTDSDPIGPFVEQFLDDVLSSPGGDSFDVMNFHYYPFFHDNWDPWGRDIIGKATYLRNKMVTEYELERPLICTEMSQWSNQADGHELQSRYVVQAFARSMAADLDIAIWFQLVDPGTGSYMYGLLNPDLSPKPSYQAYSTFARQIASASYARTIDSTETGSEQIEAYEFSRSQPPARIIVAWTIDNQEHDMWLAAGQVVVVDKFGVEATVADGDDGSTDGRVRVTIGPSPVYLRS